MQHTDHWGPNPCQTLIFLGRRALRQRRPSLRILVAQRHRAAVVTLPAERSALRRRGGGAKLVGPCRTRDAPSSAPSPAPWFQLRRKHSAISLRAFCHREWIMFLSIFRFIGLDFSW